MHDRIDPFHAAAHALPVEDRANDRLRSLAHVQPDHLVSVPAEPTHQPLTEVSGTARHQNPHKPSIDGRSARRGGASSVVASAVRIAAVSSGAGVSTIPEVIARMQAIDAALPRKDGVAIFNRLYLQVTLAVGSASAGTEFENKPFIDRLDVVFAGTYLDAEATTSSGADCPVVWRPLVETRSQAREPIQFALAGMAPHINHDLPIAVVATCEALGLAVEDDSAIHRDYERVDGLLATVETQVADWFDTGLIADIEDVTPKKTDEALAMWSLVAARDVAWDHAKVLWGLREARPLRDAYLEGLASASELAARAMLV
jgi:hypothetical protein